jgi:trimethylamine-N-oxide reductase (cytochrome c)
LKKEKAKLPLNEEQKESGEVTRRDFLVGTGTVVVGGAIGAGLLSSCSEKTITETIETTKTVEKVSTVTVGEGTPVTVTETEHVGAGETVTVTSTTTQEGGVEPAFEKEETHMGLVGGNQMVVSAIDTKNGKVVRIRGLHYDDKYTEEEIANSKWTYEGINRITGETMTLNSRLKFDPSYLGYSYKKRVYSPNRILYPLKRVDWEPGGDPAKMNTQNRGISKYKRISWEDAASIVASEIKRVQDTYGVYAVLDKSDSCHRERKNLQGNVCSYAVSALMQLVGATLSIRNADSWEGWYYGTKHVWGNGFNGAMPSENNLLLDHTQNTDMILYAGCDWDTTGAQAGMWPSQAARWYRHLGIKQVYIAPDMNFQNQSNPDKWIPVIPGRDDALLLGVIYTWLDEGTWDQEYVDTHVEGMEYIEKYVLGQSEDMVPKTPAWAAKRCGVKEWTIKALARKWAKTKTSLDNNCGGSMIRGPYTHECARLWAVCLGMQGLGKPGCNQSCELTGPTRPAFAFSLSAGAAGLSGRFPGLGGLVAYPIPEKIKQILPKPVFNSAILDGRAETWGCTSIGADVTDQFVKYTYPTEDAYGAKIHLIWQDHACQSGCWNDSNMYIHAIRDTSIECNIVQHMWMENDCLFADIVLPINTNLEEEDLVNSYGQAVPFIYHKAAIQPVGESKSDYQACCAVAQKLQDYGGRYATIYDDYTGSKTDEEWMEFGYVISGTEDKMGLSWEKMKENGYFILPVADNWQERPAGLYEFYRDPINNPLGTPSGKLEFYSERLAENFPNDKERPPYPQYICGGPGWTHDESLDIENGAERCNTYPLVMQSQHCRWRNHVQYDDVTWLREIPTCKIRGYDGYQYEPVWINPVDAEARGIKYGDIVKVYNERGIELGAAYITGKIIPGAVHMDHGSHEDMISCKEEEYDDRATKWINRGGTGNNISPYPGLSKNAPGMCVSSYLVEVQKVTGEEMQEWRDNNPEAFARDYDPDAGLTFNAWFDGGND